MTNVNVVVGSITAKLKGLEVGGALRDKLLREVATSVNAEMKTRIHENGKKSDGSPIGTYSDGYMVVRTGSYKNAGAKNSGLFTKGTTQIDRLTFSQKAGEARPNYNRDFNRKVILSLTRQMENDFSVFPTQRGYGLGFKNKFNYEKSQWNQTRFGIIYNLSSREKEIVSIVTIDVIKGAFA